MFFEDYLLTDWRTRLWLWIFGDWFSVKKIIVSSPRSLGVSNSFNKFKDSNKKLLVESCEDGCE